MSLAELVIILGASSVIASTARRVADATVETAEASATIYAREEEYN